MRVKLFYAQYVDISINEYGKSYIFKHIKRYDNASLDACLK